MNRPSRQARRALERRAEKVLARLRHMPIDADPDMDPRRFVLLFGERSDVPRAVPRKGLVECLETFGFYFDRLDELLATFEGSPRDDGAHMPVLLAIGEELVPGWVRVRLLAPGGEA